MYGAIIVAYDIVDNGAFSSLTAFVLPVSNSLCIAISSIGSFILSQDDLKCN